jgi:predicted ArsR family transcriptional regulator
MKPAWTAVLEEAGRHHTTTIRQVAEATGMRRAAARNVMLALVRRGDLQRVVHAYDPESGYKRYAFALTDEGRRRVRRRRRRPGQLALVA